MLFFPSDIINNNNIVINIIIHVDYYVNIVRDIRFTVQNFECVCYGEHTLGKECVVALQNCLKINKTKKKQKHVRINLSE